MRDPVSWAASSNQEKAQSGANILSKVNPRYRRRITGFINGCGKENISIFKYEDLIQRGLISSFSKIIGLTLSESEKSNESVTSEALALIYALNNIQTSTMGSEINYHARQFVIKEIRSFFSNSNGFKKLNLDKFDLLEPAVVDDLAWLEENFGVSYQLSPRKKQDGMTFEELPSPECLSEFFMRYSINFNKSISLTDHMEILYMKFLRHLKLTVQ